MLDLTAWVEELSTRLVHDLGADVEVEAAAPYTSLQGAVLTPVAWVVESSSGLVRLRANVEVGTTTPNVSLEWRMSTHVAWVT